MFDILPDDMREVLEALPLALVGVDARGIVLFANREAENLFGYGADELLGKPIENLVPEPVRTRHAQARTDYQRAPVTRRMGESRELAAQRRDGSSFPVAVLLKSLKSRQGDVVLAGVLDLSSQKALEAHLRDQYALMEREVAERTAALQQRTQHMEELIRSLKRAQAELERLSRHDSLTGLINRREFDERALRELQRAHRRQRPTCVAMLDLDRFKVVNDRFGHAVGDRVLRRVAAILTQQLRSDDLIARYGGEEFVVLLPETGLDDAAAVMERVCTAVADESWDELQAGLALTLSGGLVALEKGEVLEAAVERADRLLYRAKNAGRNHIER
ncbi:sensor domain-containing diguanylate cyclase [Tahibacter harae]|uniref:diguanylate cyclase n=1 Tax=Tahibacter harae TaxID=2963937 RepID=A0ABT1QLT7_9GAMM|nr:sensor domain-containing diguanylate cyclase [Tahibacter harae]